MLYVPSASSKRDRKKRKQDEYDKKKAPFYKQRHHEGGGALALHGGFGPNHAPGSLRALMLQYRAAGVLATAAPPPRAGKGARSEMNKASLHRQARDHVRLGITNNSMAPGMKHYKNQSLQF